MAVSILRQLELDRIRFYVPSLCNQLHWYAWEQLAELEVFAKDLLPAGEIKLGHFKDKHKILHRVLIYRPDAKRDIAEIRVGRTPTMKGYFSLDLYPSRYKESEFLRFQEILDMFLGEFNYAKLYLTANVTYAEFAIDSLSAKMGSLIPIFGKSTTSYVHQLEDGTGGHYVGAKTGNRFVLYDKRRQLIEQHGISSDSPIRTRIEARIHSLGMTAAKISNHLDNPFLKLELSDFYSTQQALHKTPYTGFVDRILEVGTSKALHEHPPKQRRFLRAQLLKHRVWWWKPETYWKHLPNAMATVLPNVCN